MQIQLILTLSTILLCDAKLPRFRGLHQEQPSDPNQLSSQNANIHSIPTEIRTNRTRQIISKYKSRVRRTVFDSKSYESSLIWAHSERLDDNGDVILRWVTSDSSITFKVEAKSRGYVGIGFNSGRNMKGADLVVTWVDDDTGIAQILVSAF